MTTTSLSSWVALGRDAVTLKPEPYQRLAGGRPSLRQALIIVLLVGLLIGVVQALIGIPGLFLSPQVEAKQIIQEMNESFAQIGSMFGNTDPATQEVFKMIQGSIESFAPSIEKLAAVPSPLPPIFSRLFTWLGALLSSPFALLGKWLSISIWIMLFARLLGGRGGLVPYLSASSLSTLPHLLGAFGFIPLAGGLLGLIGSVWGLIIQVKAVETTHGLSQGRAIMAVLLPYLLLLLLIFLGILMMVFGIIAASNS